jgi:hypothetical protein
MAIATTEERGGIIEGDTALGDQVLVEIEEKGRTTRKRSLPRILTTDRLNRSCALKQRLFSWKGRE